VKHGALFVLTCLVATAVGWAQGFPQANDPEDGIPFEVNPKFGSILIKAQVNGRPAKLVVDTGSSHTILSAELLQVRLLALAHAEAPAKPQGSPKTGHVGSAENRP
jgi:Aspartyl protease